MTQRPIKFRAWDKKNSKMITSVGFRDTDVGRFLIVEAYMIGGGEELPWYQTETGDNYVLMQFTGLFDKSGKEIWEGDVVRYPNNNAIIGAVGPLGDHTFQKHIVYFQGAFRCMQEIPKPESMTYTHTPGDIVAGDVYWGIEVIGNIYENPELLNSKE